MKVRCTSPTGAIPQNVNKGWYKTPQTKYFERLLRPWWLPLMQKNQRRGTRKTKRTRSSPKRYNPEDFTSNRKSANRAMKSWMISTYGHGNVNLHTFRGYVDVFGVIRNIRICRNHSEKTYQADIYYKTKKSALDALRAIRNRKLAENIGLTSGVLAEKNPRYLQFRPNNTS